MPRQSAATSDQSGLFVPVPKLPEEFCLSGQHHLAQRRTNDDRTLRGTSVPTVRVSWLSQKMWCRILQLVLRVLWSDATQQQSYKRSFFDLVLHCWLRWHVVMGGGA